MYTVKIFSPGKHKEDWLISALAEYEKRLSKEVLFLWNLPKKEEEFTKMVLLTPSYTLLDIGGHSFSSEDFSSFFLKNLHHTFVIGGPTGVPPQVREQAKMRLSFSSLTFTHQQVRLLLLEQIYRAIQIGKGTDYHK